MARRCCWLTKFFTSIRYLINLVIKDLVLNDLRFCIHSYLFNWINVFIEANIPFISFLNLDQRYICCDIFTNSAKIRKEISLLNSFLSKKKKESIVRREFQTIKIIFFSFFRYFQFPISIEISSITPNISLWLIDVQHAHLINLKAVDLKYSRKVKTRV